MSVENHHISSHAIEIRLMKAASFNSLPDDKILD